MSARPAADSSTVFSTGALEFGEGGLHRALAVQDGVGQAQDVAAGDQLIRHQVDFSWRTSPPRATPMAPPGNWPNWRLALKSSWVIDALLFEVTSRPSVGSAASWASVVPLFSLRRVGR
ncbi:hypothetical protein ACHMW6_23855 [Pseudoduganella sp. UC29_106]|uniref:hypothetical protein n=1 Tax=Pseudoduganella sp. UC29_106 TaxID=3374553 RepID=UPI003756EBF4